MADVGNDIVNIRKCLTNVGGNGVGVRSVMTSVGIRYMRIYLKFGLEAES